MKTFLLLLISLFAFNFAMAQDKVTSLQSFENLVGGTWEGEGRWNGGSPFKLNIEYKWGFPGTWSNPKLSVISAMTDMNSVSEMRG